MTNPGTFAASTMERCFPETLQLPVLGSPSLRALQDDLRNKISEASSQAPSEPDKASALPVSADIKLTTNRAGTYASSGSARTDLFFKFKGRDRSSSAKFDLLLQQAWQEDPTDTLKLIAHLRDVRGGKGEQPLFHDFVTWLRQKHPLTLIANLDEIVQVGYYKDLLEVLVRMCVSPAQMEERKQHAADRKLEEYKKRKGAKRNKKGTKEPTEKEAWRSIPEVKHMRKKSFRKYLRSLKTEAEREQAKADRSQQTAKKHQLIQDFIAAQKKEKRLSNVSNVIRLIQEDNVFRLLHIRVAMLFSEQLQKDLASLKEGKPTDVSLAAKWAPTPGGSHDKDTLMAATIAEFLYPAAQHRKDREPYNAFVARIKALYHKEVLAPLRRCLDVPEVYMSTNAWDSVKYPRVPSVCMKKNKRHFEKHDEERFAKYLEDVKAGKKKIASGALKPHELVSEAMQHTQLLLPFQQTMNIDSESASDDMSSDGSDSEKDRSENEHMSDGGQNASSALSLETMQLQWESYVKKLKESGTLSNALAVCDVSGSMSGQPMEVAIALSLLVAEVTAPPFNDTVCTFSASPQLHNIQRGTLIKQVQDLQRMDWGMNTDIDAVFDLILERAVTSNLPPEQMIETIFIFSDMQFDVATRSCSPYGASYFPGAPVPPPATGTNYKVAQANFEEQGYKLPKIVFWNLREDECDAVPVSHTEEGTALVSGFSGQLLKLFMAGAAELEKFDPFTIMKEAISADKYSGWKVVD